jgi:hypothetical protein
MHDGLDSEIFPTKKGEKQPIKYLKSQHIHTFEINVINFILNFINVNSLARLYHRGISISFAFIARCFAECSSQWTHSKTAVCQCP